MQPLGWPVVPEVKKIAASSSAGGRQVVGSAAVSGLGGHQSTALSGAHAGRSLNPRMTQRGSTAARMVVAACGFVSRSNGTTIAPSFQSANRYVGVRRPEG